MRYVNVNLTRGDPLRYIHCITMTSHASAPHTIKILYNNCYGGFGFSEEFEAAYKERTGKNINHYIVICVSKSIRTDPIAIDLFEKLGSERASAENASLKVREISALFERYWTIEDYCGDETVHVNINEAYADILHHYMDSGDSVALCNGYRAVKAAAGQLLKSSGIGLEENDIVPPILKRPSIVGEEDEYSRTVGYTYYGIGTPPTDVGAGHT